MTGDRNLTVLVIGGTGRSGSTLLDRLLGELPGFAAVGEARYLWGEALAGNRRCGCGARFLDCPFWSGVGERAFGGWDRIDPARAVAVERSVARHRYLPLLVGDRAPGWYASRLDRYLALLTPLYTAIREVSGADVIVDSSKDAVFAHVLRRLPGVDMRLLHLVRDSRGVAWSWAKVTPSGDDPGQERYLRRFSPVVTGARWAARNLLVESLGRSGVPRLLLCYEALVADPAAALAAAAAFAGRPAAGGLPFLEPGGAWLGVHHTVAGNPMRLRAGPLPIRPDDAWRTAMPLHQQVAVAALTWPLLRRYQHAAGPGSGTGTPVTPGRAGPA